MHNQIRNIFANKSNKIRDLFKVKLYTINSETKKREREIGRQTYVNPSTDRGFINDPN